MALSSGMEAGPIRAALGRRARIALLFPALPMVRVTHKDMQPPGDRMLRFPPLALLTVAGLTPPSLAECAIFDEHVEYIDVQKIAADFDLAGISISTSPSRRGYQLADQLRALGLPVAIGGYHASACPEEARQHADFVFTGDVGQTWAPFIEDFVSGRAEPGIIREPHRARSDKPVLYRKWAPRDLVAHNKQHYGTINMIQASQGCFFRCSFCHVITFNNHTVRMRPPRDVADEMRSLGPGPILFADDNIVADKRYFLELCTELAKVGKPWMSESTINLADDQDMLQAARRAHFVGLFAGFESPNAATLQGWHKMHNLGKATDTIQRYRSVVERLHRYGIAVEAGLTFGANEDTPAVFEAALEMVRQVPFDIIQITALTPFPSTPLFDQMQRDHVLLTDDWERYDTVDVVHRPKQMTAQELWDGTWWLRREVYKFMPTMMRWLKNLPVGLYPSGVSFKLGQAYRHDHALNLNYPP